MVRHVVLGAFVLSGLSCSAESESTSALDVVGWLESGCVATVVSRQWVVTAAHCPMTPTVIVFPGERRIRVDFCVSHDAASMGMGTDIAVCRLAIAVGSRATLGFRNLEVGERMVAVGFDPDQRGEALRTWPAEVVVSDREAQLRVPRDAVCRGDSGGPVFASRGGSLVLAGVASSRPRGTSCEDGSLVNYTKLNSVEQWVRSAIAD